MQKFFLVTLLGVAALLSGCGKASVATLEAKDTGIVNGIVTTDYPAVVQIRKYGYPHCTATAVSDSTIVTAAHCVDPVPGGNISYMTPAGVLKNAVASLNSVEVDVSVVVFEKGTFSSHLSLLDRAPKAGDTLKLVGYGQFDYINNGPVDGQKRVGLNSLLVFADRKDSTISHSLQTGDYLHYRSSIVIDTPPGEESMTGRGDSGGPIFIDDKLAGVTSFGATREVLVYRYNFVNEPSPDNSLIYEYDTNLSSPAARRLLTRATAEIGAVINGL